MGQGPTALAMGAGVGFLVDIFSHISITSLFFLPLLPFKIIVIFLYFTVLIYLLPDFALRA